MPVVSSSSAAASSSASAARAAAASRAAFNSSDVWCRTAEPRRQTASPPSYFLYCPRQYPWIGEVARV
eukprot:1394049-Prymnesium_polylepis.1